MRPFRTVLLWQLIATAVLTLAAAIVWGRNGALSAAFGGSINLAAGGAYGWIASRRKARSAAEALRTMFRAEAAQVLLVVVVLWIACATYLSLVHVRFLGSFELPVAIFAAAIAVRDKDEDQTPRANGEQ